MIASAAIDEIVAVPIAAPSRDFAGEAAAVRALRVLVLLGLFSLIFLPEYVQGNGDPGTKSFLYAPVAGGFRLIDVVLIVVGVTHAAANSASRKRAVRLSRDMKAALLFFGFAVMLSIGNGVMHDGQNLFFDWRAIALGIGLYFVYVTWIRNSAEAVFAAKLFGGYVACRVGMLYAQYLAGSGTMLLGLRIPVFDGPTLSAIVFAALLGFALAGGSPGWAAGMWLVASGAASLLVVLCFRRTYWTELALGAALLMVLRGQRRTVLLVVLALAVATAFLALGAPLSDRLRSLNFLESSSHYSGDNADHVGDLQDAWAQIKEAPILGLGLGRSYPTWEIRNWKDESVMVHNAALHVWLKYGIPGLGSYLMFHAALFRHLHRRRKKLQGAQAALVSVIFAYLVAQFVVSLGFAPWPYSAVQSTNLIAFLLAETFCRDHHATSITYGRHPLVQLRRVS